MPPGGLIIAYTAQQPLCRLLLDDGVVGQRDAAIDRQPKPLLSTASWAE
jgi:hypothetical protein